MILKIKFNLYQILKLISFLFLINIYSLYAHNLFNGGCEGHCVQNFKAFKKDNRLNNINDQIDFEIENSCLNKSLCRG